MRIQSNLGLGVVAGPTALVPRYCTTWTKPSNSIFHMVGTCDSNPDHPSMYPSISIYSFDACSR